ncbi:MAG: hypothetical protein N3F06_03775, partial [Nitrososphaerales archaeon]|nr:hypothetical protein [Nitrososphaerales archaeon]
MKDHLKSKRVNIGVKIVPTDDVPDTDLHFALNTYREAFVEYVSVKISGEVLSLSKIPYRMTTFGRQYLADAILELGIRMREDDVIIILTSADIYTGNMNYIFGLATIGSAII